MLIERLLKDEPFGVRLDACLNRPAP